MGLNARNHFPFSKVFPSGSPAWLLLAHYASSTSFTSKTYSLGLRNNSLSQAPIGITFLSREMRGCWSKEGLAWVLHLLHHDGRKQAVLVRIGQGGSDGRLWIAQAGVQAHRALLGPQGIGLVVNWWLMSKSQQSSYNRLISNLRAGRSPSMVPVCGVEAAIAFETRAQPPEQNVLLGPASLMCSAGFL